MTSATFSAPFSRLTPREREVLGLICSGLTGKQMALALGISPRTVEAHRANIKIKSGAANTAQLVRFALRMG